MASTHPKVLGVLAGEILSAGALRTWALSADLILAADSGADRLLEAGVRIDVLIGDLDSASAEAQKAAPRMVEVPDQNATDCDKLLAFAHSEGLCQISLAAVEGSLPDHQLATLHSAARSPVATRIIYERGLAHILKGPQEVAFEHEGRLSLLPITECVGISLAGVRWPIEGDFSPTGISSISNEGLGQVRVQVVSGAAFLFLETGGEAKWDSL